MRVATRPTTSTPVRLWSSPSSGTKPLPRSCSQVPTSRRSGRATRPVQGGRVGRRLAQVPVDGEAVVGVALGPARHRRPLRQQPDQQALLVERLQHRDGGPARARGGSTSERRASSGHGSPGPTASAASRLSADRLRAAPAAGRGRRRPQHQAPVVGRVGVGRQLHPPVPQHQARRRGRGPAPPSARRGPAARSGCGPTCRRWSRPRCGRRPPPGP